MISICTVIVDSCLRYLPIYFQSIKTRTSLVDEVLIAKPDSPRSFSKSWQEVGISFNQFGTMDGSRLQQGVEHGLGLHECLERAKNDLVLFHDPDVFYYSEVDEFFYNLLEKYQLNLVGISHCSAPKFAYTFFPYLSNMLFRKSQLPDDSWHGKFLVRMKMDENAHLFPNPQGDFDTGSYLWLWAFEQKWKWLAFQTVDVHRYTTKYFRGNVKLTEKLPKKNLLYHATSCTVPGSDDTFTAFEKEWFTNF